MSEQDGSIAIVTGGTRGIGHAVVEGLLERGGRVFFCGRDAATVARVEGEWIERFAMRESPRVWGAAVDVRDPVAVQAFVARANEQGNLDLLVNNAGVGRFGAVDEMSLAAWHEVVETNLSGCFYFLREVAARMKPQGSGWIVNVGSLASKNAFAGGAAYNASKFGLLGLSEAAMLDLRPFGVRVATILPGSVDTEFGHPRGAEEDRSWRLTPHDVARMILHLLDYPQGALPSSVEMRPTFPKR